MISYIQLTNNELLNNRLMRDYRKLTQEEINVLESNSCWAEDWNKVKVDEEFRPYNFHRVVFYGDIRLRSFGGVQSLRACG